MIGPPRTVPLLTSSSTASPVISLRVNIVEATIRALLAENAVRTTYKELLRYIRMMLLISCYMKLLEYFWRTTARTGDCLEDNENDMPLFTFNRYMSRWRYLALTLALRLTTKPPPSFRDKFWQIRDLISAWNKHMQAIFVAAWALCLDESMSI